MEINWILNGMLMEWWKNALAAITKHEVYISITKRFSWTGDSEVGNYKWFSDTEVAGLDKELVAMLDLARGKSGVPFVITCGLRTPEQNAALAESVSDSAHLTGHGVDLACSDSPTRFAMLSGLLAAGFNRIGVYEKHIHADNSKTLPPNVCWYSRGT